MKITEFVGMVLPLVLALAGCKTGSGDSADNARLQYSPSLSEVRTIELKREDFPLQILSNGKLEASKRCDLSFEGSGIITEINFSNGDYVSKGQVIARLADSDRKLALESAEIALRKAELEYLDVLAGLGYSDESQAPQEMRDLSLIRSGLASARNEYGKAKASLEAAALRAPVSGKVANISLRTYDSTDGKPFCTVIDDSSFDVTFNILESEYSLVRKGQSVSVRPFGRDASESFKGTVQNVNPTIDENGQIAVRASVKGNSSMIDGMNVKIVVDKFMDRMLVVPKSAVVVRDRLDVLFRYRDGRAEWVYVDILGSNSESYAVTANESRGAVLEEGDQVIVSGNLNLAEGSAVVLVK